MSKSSLSEVEYRLSLVSRLGYLEKKDLERLNALEDTAARTLFGLIQFMKKEI